MSSPGYNWFVQVLLVIDVALNVLAGGYWFMTISGRVGYHANFAYHKDIKKWKRAEIAIDWMMMPIEGPSHCYRTYVYIHNKQNVTEHSTYRINTILLMVMPGAYTLGVLIRLFLLITKPARLFK